MTAADHRPAPRTDRAATAAALVLSVPLGVVTGAAGAALPLLRESYGLPPGSGVELVMLYNLGALLALLALGGARARARARTLLASLTCLFAAAIGGMAVAVRTAETTGWGLLLSLATAAGFGFGGLILLLNSYAGENFGHRQLTVLNLLHACFGAGAVTGPLLMASGTGPVPVLAAAALVTALCLPVRRAPLAPTPPPPAGSGDPSGPAARRPRLLLAAFAAVSLLYAGLESSVAALASTHLTGLGHPASRATGLTGLFWAGLTVGRLVVPRLTRTWSPARPALTGLLAGAAALLSTVLGDWAPAGYALAGLALSVVFPTVLAQAFTALGDGQRVAAVLLLLNLAGSAALPGAVAAAGAGGAAGIPLALAASALLTAAVLAAANRLAAPRTRRTTAPAVPAAPARPAAPRPAPDHVPVKETPLR
ncbi:MFS transporter [Streptomyces sp. NPDC059506]|uniref:MFS transporter n=1 Tax=Streptomyces sp. NPDC059506 TaxID=3347751 RepID=UPI0036B2F357